MPIFTHYDSESHHHLHRHSCTSLSPAFLVSDHFIFDIFLFAHLQANAKIVDNNNNACSTDSLDSSSSDDNEDQDDNLRA